MTKLPPIPASSAVTGLDGQPVGDLTMSGPAGQLVFMLCAAALPARAAKLQFTLGPVELNGVQHAALVTVDGRDPTSDSSTSIGYLAAPEASTEYALFHALIDAVAAGLRMIADEANQLYPARPPGDALRDLPAIGAADLGLTEEQYDALWEDAQRRASRISGDGTA